MMSGLEERDASNRAGALSRGQSTLEVLSQPAAGTCTSFNVTTLELRKLPLQGYPKLICPGNS